MGEKCNMRRKEVREREREMRGDNDDFEKKLKC